LRGPGAGSRHRYRRGARLAVVRSPVCLHAPPGEAMIPEPQRLALLEGSKLKLAAKARLAEGGKHARYEASVLLHAAARAERGGIRAWEGPTAEAGLAGAVEGCGCLIDGADPTAVREAGAGAPAGWKGSALRRARARRTPGVRAHAPRHEP